ncbi:hypothetical protein X560_0457 [Listeria fleischmannii 1991]|uniref:Uncharacterized protein n=1 Tax=Listeria fleischmannii 1991 TaxID=1430899 RepID=A0A0J8J8Y0_9LIST|nr:hypothetical protein [Listeria fleischmannii]EMG28972.1 hypothetical protein LFLEISCH_02505 [Listeria fleischmannii subsp. fleischmannii LU2006-1]KMT60766.1 hypothetical protein X560_0457 [Listeria fleischmannii 1991]
MNPIPIVHEPMYMTLYVLIIIAVFFVALFQVLSRYTFNYMGKIFIGLTFLSLLFLFIYELETAFLSDTTTLVFGAISIKEVFLFTHPYIFLILAVLLGGKKRN